jgi:hypothetical protein
MQKLKIMLAMEDDAAGKGQLTPLLDGFVELEAHTPQEIQGCAETIVQEVKEKLTVEGVAVAVMKLLKDNK